MVSFICTLEKVTFVPKFIGSGLKVKLEQTMPRGSWRPNLSGSISSPNAKLILIQGVAMATGLPLLLATLN